MKPETWEFIGVAAGMNLLILSVAVALDMLVNNPVVFLGWLLACVMAVLIGLSVRVEE